MICCNLVVNGIVNGFTLKWDMLYLAQLGAQVCTSDLYARGRDRSLPHARSNLQESNYYYSLVKMPFEVHRYLLCCRFHSG